ncbi:hypothetical protein C8F01DRAFT_121864 [Mycena amicta]|nr:hypothetical protein C8F01DRAFT_121864 [Mycena amicta]
MKISSCLFALACALSVAASPRMERVVRRGQVEFQNAIEALAINKEINGRPPLLAGSPCTGEGFVVCAGAHARGLCVDGKLQLQKCGHHITCAALPNVGRNGTTLACNRPADVSAKINLAPTPAKAAE